MEGLYPSSPRSLAGTPLPGRLDVAQALSGVALALFALAHAVFVGSVIVGPGVMDALGAFFEATYLAQIGGPLLFLLLFLHFALAARKMPLRTGELLTFIRHAQAVKHADTRLWLVQAGTALVVLALAPVHMLEVLASLPVEAAKSAEREAGRLAFYSALLVCVGLHMSLGLYRAGVKYGFIGGDGRSLWLRRAWALAALYCGIGLCVMLRFRLMV